MGVLRQHKPIDKQIGEYIFHIRPFGGFTSAHLSGELASFLAPLLGSSGPMISKLMSDDDAESGVLDKNISSVAPELAELLNGLSTMNGKKVEKMMKTLLTDYDNIAYTDGDGVTRRMTEDEANDIFCCNITDMYVLAIEVIKVNFSGFFEKLSTRFGDLFDVLRDTTKESTENFTSIASLT